MSRPSGSGGGYFSVTGILWILIGLFVLQAHYGSAVAIGYLVGFWLLFAGIAEFIEIGVVDGWKWVHAVLGVLFVIGGIAALISPFQTFTILATLVGFFLILKGTFDFVIALAMRHEVDLWWMTLIAGIIEIALGIWAIGYPGRSAALLIIWVGIGAIIRGIAEIVMAFHVHKLPRRSRYEGATDRPQRNARRVGVRAHELFDAGASRTQGQGGRRPDLQGEELRTTPTRRSGTSTGRTTSSTTSPASPAAMFVRTFVTWTGTSIRWRAAMRPSKT